MFGHSPPSDTYIRRTTLNITMKKGEGQYPDGYFRFKAMALGIALGAPLGLFLGEPGLMGLGAASGMCVGLGTGSIVEVRLRRGGRMRRLRRLVL